MAKSASAAMILQFKIPGNIRLDAALQEAAAREHKPRRDGGSADGGVPDRPLAPGDKISTRSRSAATVQPVRYSFLDRLPELYWPSNYSRVVLEPSRHRLTEKVPDLFKHALLMRRVLHRQHFLQLLEELALVTREFLGNLHIQMDVQITSRTGIQLRHTKIS